MLQTPLHGWHNANGGRMVDFAGWEMPVQYTSITEEHQAVRTSAGLFDISHMGRLAFRGTRAGEFLDQLVTNDVNRIVPGRIRYALVTNDEGGILDDVLVYNLEDYYLMVVNASNREKLVSWIESRNPTESGVDFEDWTVDRGMIAVQGPAAVEIVESTVTDSPRGLPYYASASTSWRDQQVLVSRTGYTGEDGFELILAADHVEAMWLNLLDHGRDQELTACGLGCRDTLRLEAGMPLYGHELSESIDPLTAGLRFGVKLEAGPFTGRNAIRTIDAEGTVRNRVGLRLEGRRIARENTPVLSGDEFVGEVTSGTFSPTLEQSIAMAYVDSGLSSPGTILSVEIRGRRISAEVVSLPFYQRPSA